MMIPNYGTRILDESLSWLPYELIGKVVVSCILIALGIIIALIAIWICLYTWVRVWAKLSNRMYKGYNPTDSEERPPVWKMRISGISMALSRFEFRKIPQVYDEAESLTENETSFAQLLADILYKQDVEETNT